MKMSTLKPKIAQLPQKPGVYFFLGAGGEILYIGKATSLRSRVQSYFRGQTDANLRMASVAGRSEWISLMIAQVENIDFQETDSVLEALILESNLIKKHQPKYNTQEKDDKSFSYFVITKEEFPRVLIVRKTDLENSNKYICHSGLDPESSHAHKSGKVLDSRLCGNDNELRLYNKSKKNPSKLKNSKLEIKNSAAFGPYTSKHQMQIALKIIRRIFPFHSLRQKSEKGCLDFQIGMCPGPHAGAISKEDYKKNIRAIKLILEGKKKHLISTLEKEMTAAGKKEEFEKAADLRNKIFALEHIRDVALMTREDSEGSTFGGPKVEPSSGLRIEAYDISNISGTNAVGSMVVFENGKPEKSEYRKFKIKTIVGSDDVGSMREVLLRRFKNDWLMPDLILLDGGVGHANMMSELVMTLGLDVLVIAVAKGPTRKNLNFQFPISNKIPMSKFPKEIQNFLNNKNLVKQIMDEAHRFAITFHRKLRRKSALK